MQLTEFYYALKFNQRERPTPRVNVDQEAELNNTSEFVTTTVLAPKSDGKPVASKAAPVLNQQPNEPELMVKPETIFSKNETSRPRRNAATVKTLTKISISNSLLN